MGVFEALRTCESIELRSSILNYLCATGLAKRLSLSEMWCDRSDGAERICREASNNPTLVLFAAVLLWLIWVTFTWSATLAFNKLQATHGLWSSAGLQMPIHAQFYRPAIWASKVGQSDLVFDVRSGFASGYVHARLEVSVYIQRFRLMSLWLSQNWFVHFDPLWPWKVGQTPRYSTSISDAPTMQIWWPQTRRFQRYCT